jgi:hypothetical protein
MMLLMINFDLRHYSFLPQNHGSTKMHENCQGDEELM